MRSHIVFALLLILIMSALVHFFSVSCVLASDQYGELGSAVTRKTKQLCPHTLVSAGLITGGRERSSVCTRVWVSGSACWDQRGCRRSCLGGEICWVQAPGLFSFLFFFLHERAIRGRRQPPRCVWRKLQLCFSLKRRWRVWEDRTRLTGLCWGKEKEGRRAMERGGKRQSEEENDEGWTGPTSV